MDRDFFRVVLMGHFYLWLPEQIGQPIVASATLIFVIMLISGIILMVAEKQGSIKATFYYQSGARSGDEKIMTCTMFLAFMHHGLQSYSGLTGLIWGFEWFAKSVYSIAGWRKFNRLQGADIRYNKKDKSRPTCNRHRLGKDESGISKR